MIKELKEEKKEKEDIEKLKQTEEIKIQANIRARIRFISALKRIRKSKDYSQNKVYRQGVVRGLRRFLDYPNFENINLRAFFSIKQLGTIVPIRVKAKILANRRKFTELMKFICNEKIPIKVRIDEALNGRLSIENISEAFISKILVMHNPKKYYLHNEVFSDRLRPFGLYLPRGLSFGEKYEMIRDMLKEIMKETNIDNFAILDHCIFEL